MAGKFNHAYSIGFSLESSHPKGEDVTPDMLRAALEKRIADLNATDDGKGIEWLEACGAPWDTYELEDEADHAA